MTARKWRRVSYGDSQDCRIFTMRDDLFVSPRTGEEHRFIVLESADWVTTVAVTADERLVFVTQFRPGLDGVTIETPGGLVEAGFTPEEAAVEELRQETGYGGGEWLKLGELTPVPAVFTNHLHVFLARGVEIVSEPELDAAEDVHVRLMTFQEAKQGIREGWLNHAQVIAGLYLYEMWLADPGRANQS